MADTGYNWGSFVFADDEDGLDWDARALADTATEVSDTAVSLDVIAACEVGIAAYEDNTGAIDGVVTIFILGTADGTNYEETTIGSPISFSFTPVINDTVYIRFDVDPAHFGSFKIAIENQGGQEIAFTVKYRTATIPLAS